MKFLLFILVFCSLTAGAKTYTGTVIRVIDGDTFTLRSGEETFNCRIWGIDAPEYKQDFGFASWLALWLVIRGRDVKIKIMGANSYGRKVVSVYFGGRNLALDMLQSGLAWWSSTYAPGRNDYARAMDKARTRKLGLWSSPDPVPPWKFRLLKK